MQLFRFGVNVGRATSRAAWAAKARQCEDLGYAVLTGGLMRRGSRAALGARSGRRRGRWEAPGGALPRTQKVLWNSSPRHSPCGPHVSHPRPQ
jgi:hypothetical protein